MGRHAGWIALQGGLAGGADIILLPEMPFEYEKIAAEIDRRHRERRRRGRARRGLDHRGAEADALGLRRDPRQGRDGVGTVDRRCTVREKFDAFDRRSRETVKVEDRTVAAVCKRIRNGAATVDECQEALGTETAEIRRGGTTGEARRLVDRIRRTGIERETLDKVADVRVAFGFDFRGGKRRHGSGGLDIEPLDAGTRHFEFLELLGVVFLLVGLLRVLLRGETADAENGEKTETGGRESGRQ